MVKYKVGDLVAFYRSRIYDPLRTGEVVEVVSDEVVRVKEDNGWLVSAHWYELELIWRLDK